MQNTPANSATKDSSGTLTWLLMSAPTLVKNHSSVLNVTEHLHAQMDCNVTCSYTTKRGPLSVITAIKDSMTIQAWKNTPTVILVWSLSNVNIVDGPSVTLSQLRNIYWFILAQSLINASFVCDHLMTLKCWSGTFVATQVKNLSSVNTAKWHSANRAPLSFTQESILEKSHTNALIVQSASQSLATCSVTFSSTQERDLTSVLNVPRLSTTLATCRGILANFMRHNPNPRELWITDQASVSKQTTQINLSLHKLFYWWTLWHLNFCKNLHINIF